VNGCDKISPKGFVWRMLRFIVNQVRASGNPCRQAGAYCALERSADAPARFHL
jgi:hypothetical protein